MRFVQANIGHRQRSQFSFSESCCQKDCVDQFPLLSDAIKPLRFAWLEAGAALVGGLVDRVEV
jgi:hypothetical protein